MMKKVHSILRIGLLIMVLSITGCVDPKVTPAELQAMAQAQKQLSDQVDAYQVIADQLKAQMESSGVVDPVMAARYDKLAVTIDAIQASANQIGKAIEEAKYSDGGTFKTIFEGVQAGNGAAPPYPGKEMVSLALIAAGAVGTAIGKIRKACIETKRADKNEAAFVQTVKGVDKAFVAGAIDKDKFAVAMDAKQSTETKAMVDRVQGKV
jgi:hypothetical protein